MPNNLYSFHRPFKIFWLIQSANYEGMGYGRWRAEQMFALAPAQALVGKWLQSFKEFPPRQKPGSSNLSDAMDKLSKGNPGN